MADLVLQPPVFRARVPVLQVRLLQLSLFGPPRVESESSGHVRGKVQAVQGHQVHDKGWEVPGPDIRRSLPGKGLVCDLTSCSVSLPIVSHSCSSLWHAWI